MAICQNDEIVIERINKTLAEKNFAMRLFSVYLPQYLRRYLKVNAARKHERENWTDFRWDASQVSLLQDSVFPLSNLLSKYCSYMVNS